MQQVTEQDNEITALLADPATELVAILPALAHALSDMAYLPEDLRPDTSNPFAEQGGWDNEQQIGRAHV